MNVCRKQIADAVYNKLDKTVHKIVIADIIDETFYYIFDQLANHKSVSIENFGTYSTYKRNDLVYNNGKFFEIRANVKFRPHYLFLNLCKSQKKSSKS